MYESNKGAKPISESVIVVELCERQAAMTISRTLTGSPTEDGTARTSSRRFGYSNRFQADNYPNAVSVVDGQGEIFTGSAVYWPNSNSTQAAV